MSELSQAIGIFLGQIYLDISDIGLISLVEAPYIPATDYTVVSWLVVAIGYIIALSLQFIYNRLNPSQER